MDYAEARAAFFSPRIDAAADDLPSDPGRRLRHVLEPIATIHYWSEPANDGYAANGLDFLTGYVWSRACVLGEPDGAVVASAFGVFEPGLIAGLYDTARQACSLDTIRTVRADGARTALVAAFGSTDGAAVAAATLRRAVDAADTTGRALFAGAAALVAAGSTGDEVIDLWLAANALRECRGDSHLAACTAAGLTGLEANLLTEMQVGWEPQTYTGTRGWSADAMSSALDGLREQRLVDGVSLTDEGRRLRERVEETTEQMTAPVLAAIGDDLDDVVEACAAWSDAVIERGWFPPDPYKRASG